MNKFIISGNLTENPTLAYSAQGKAYAKFTVAVTRNFDREKTDFFRCTTFGKQAENLAQYQVKGNKLLVEGEVQIDQNDGKYYTNVIASNIEYLTPKGGQEKPQQQSNQDPFANAGTVSDISESELPF